MAAQFDTTKTVLQPGQQVAPVQTNVFEYGAQVAAQLGGWAMQDAAQQGQKQNQLYAQAINTASSGFDRVLTEYNKYAEQKANEEAPASIKYDGDNNIIPPSSFYPPGVSIYAYGETFARAGKATYKQGAELELINHANVMKEKYAADPTGFRKAMDEKTAAMQQNLDPSVKAWVDVRGRQITSQGLTQISVQAQSAANTTLKLSADTALAAIGEDALKLAGSHPVAQGGGGGVAGYNNNLGNKKVSADPYHGGKGLPYTNPQDNEKYETFTSAEQGAAASYHLIKKKVDYANGLMTFEGLVESWTRNASKESKANYAKMMADGAGLKPTDQVPIGDDAKMAGVLKGMNQFEKGKRTVSDTAIEGGIKLAKGDKSVPLTGVASDVAGLNDPKAAEDAATRAINHATIQERIRNWKDSALAVEQPAIVERKIEELKINIQLRAIGEQIRNSHRALYGTDGFPNPAARADAEENIRKIALSGRFPGRETQVMKQLMGDLDWASNQATQRAQQIRVDDQRLVAPQIREMADLSAAAKEAGRNDNTLLADTITRQLEARGRSYLNNPSLSDSAAMSLSASAFQNGAISRGALQEANDNRISSIASIQDDPAQGPDQKAAAYVNAQAIRNDTAVWQTLTTGQRSAVQGIMDKHVRQNFGQQLGAWHAEIAKGETSPSEIDRVTAEQYAKNMIPPGQEANVALLNAQAKAKWHEKNTQSQLAANHLNNFARGVGSSKEEIEAHKKEVKWGPPGGAKAVDLQNPEHVKAAQEFYQKYGYMPDLVKSALEGLVYSAEEGAVAGHKALFNTITQVEREQIDKAFGNKLMSQDKDQLLAGNVAAIIGKHHSYLKIATRHGAVEAAKYMAAFGGEPSKAGNAGGTADQTRNDLYRSAANLSGLLSRTAQSGSGAQAIDDMGELLVPDQDLTHAGRAERAVSGLIRGPGVGNYIASMFPSLTGKGLVQNVRIEPGVVDSFVERSMVLISTNGKAIGTGVGPDGSVSDFVMNTTLANAVKNGELSATLSEDGKTATLGWRTLGDTVGKAMNIEMTNKMVQQFATNLVSADRLRTGSTAAEINSDRVTVSSYEAYNGERRMRIVEQDRNGIFHQLEDMAMNDPRISLQALSVVKAATLAVVANAASPQVYGDVLTTVATSGMFGPVGSNIRLKWPVDDWVNVGSLVGHAVQQLQLAIGTPEQMRLILGDKKLMSEEDLQNQKAMYANFTKSWNDVDAALKKMPNAPSLQSVMDHMLANHAPLKNDSPLRQLILDSGVYQPGRLPQVQTGPSRIGKQDPR